MKQYDGSAEGIGPILLRQLQVYRGQTARCEHLALTLVVHMRELSEDNPGANTFRSYLKNCAR